jgi:hypothetical protein
MRRATILLFAVASLSSFLAPTPARGQCADYYTCNVYAFYEPTSNTIYGYSEFRDMFWWETLWTEVYYMPPNSGWYFWTFGTGMYGYLRVDYSFNPTGEGPWAVSTANYVEWGGLVF